MRTEVLLLSRNILIQGDSLSKTFPFGGYGGHLMMHGEGSVGRVSYAEFTEMG